ncbi:hypothetical protein TNIN_268971 [Trichonephila inaurata madagascariensis]|uniref:C2H2-type domain-containing protein n=1 Tax=Trichonephila inaurata madagascariensis TaxID=2747483 RepID=A0A8X6Y249_9ARAC|nr:hypothetical protein TNIN_268971 [Trichonephila inaurata madagascariensis]
MTDAHSGDDTKYVCDMCNRTFQFRSHYLKHMKVHKDIVFHKCFKCAAAFNSFIQFRDHLETHEQGTALKCGYCSESFISPAARRLHENNHFIGKRFICEVWNRKFETEMSLQQHLPLHGPEKPINSGVYTGEFIQKKVEENSTHDHDGEKQLRCHICGKIFVYYAMMIKESEIMIFCSYTFEASLKNLGYSSWFRPRCRKTNVE